MNEIISTLTERLFPAWAGKEEQDSQTVLARKDAGWCGHARHRCLEGSESRRASWKREKLKLSLEMSDRLQVSGRMQGAFQ